MNAKMMYFNIRRRKSNRRQTLIIDKYGVRIYRTCFGNTRYVIR